MLATAGPSEGNAMFWLNVAVMLGFIAVCLTMLGVIIGLIWIVGRFLPSRPLKPSRVSNRTKERQA
jgi:flagellar biogenesis protein FliO